MYPGRATSDSANYAQLGKNANLTYTPVSGGSNIIADARKTDWTQAGATIPTGRTKSGSTIAAYSGSPATITAALAAAADNTYVELGAGTFNLNAALNIAQKDNVTLRGQGMSTILKFSSDSGSAWPFGGAGSPITICGSPSWTTDATPTVTGAPGSAYSVTGTNGVAGLYSKDATILTVAAGHGFAVGDSGVIVQTNYSDASVPRAGFFTSTKVDHSGSTTNGANWQGAYENFGAILHQRFVVTNVSGNDITISPGLVHSFYESAYNPRVYRFASGIFASGVGLENVLVDTTSLSTLNALLGMCRAKECWVSGVGFLPDAAGGGDYGIAVTDSYKYTIRNSWIDELTGGGIYTTTSYGVAIQGSHWGLIENNIFNEVESPLMVNIGCVGNVLSYNYEKHVSGEGGLGHHQPGCCYNLMEGNSVLKFSGDLFHGNSLVETAFRNHCFDRGFDLQSYHRFWNIIGNTIEASVIRKTLPTDSTLYDRFDSFGFRLGYNGQNASINAFYNGSPNIGVAVDNDVFNTAFLWYNYTTTGGTQSNASEVPSSDATLPNPVPADNSIPDSQYKLSRPGFFTVSGYGTVNWPPIGPDVTGGDYMGGRAHKLPAQRAYDLAGGAIASFNPSVYG